MSQCVAVCCSDYMIQPIADRVAQNLEIISKTFSTNQNSTHGIYDEYPVIHDQSHENPGRLVLNRKFLEIISKCCATLSVMGCTHISLPIKAPDMRKYKITVKYCRHTHLTTLHTAIPKLTTGVPSTDVTQNETPLFSQN